jgi:uncharacterized protein YdhG (YjbR/CyaY superfamily)
MAAKKQDSAPIDAYIATFPADVQAKLKKVRATIRKAAPTASEAIKYRIPTFVLDGNLIFFAGFKNHIGVYPPVKSSGVLKKKLAAYEGAGGSFRFPLDEAIPYDLITEIVKLRIKDNRERAAAKSVGKPARKKT